MVTMSCHLCLDDDGGERKGELTTMCSQSVVMQWRLLWLLVTEALMYMARRAKVAQRNKVTLLIGVLIYFQSD